MVEVVGGERLTGFRRVLAVSWPTSIQGGTGQAEECKSRGKISEGTGEREKEREIKNKKNRGKISQGTREREKEREINFMFINLLYCTCDICIKFIDIYDLCTAFVQAKNFTICVLII